MLSVKLPGFSQCAKESFEELVDQWAKKNVTSKATARKSVIPVDQLEMFVNELVETHTAMGASQTELSKFRTLRMVNEDEEVSVVVNTGLVTSCSISLFIFKRSGNEVHMLMASYEKAIDLRSSEDWMCQLGFRDVEAEARLKKLLRLGGTQALEALVAHDLGTFLANKYGKTINVEYMTEDK